MQGTAKVEVKVHVEFEEKEQNFVREYNFFFPQNAPSKEVLEVCEALLNGFKKIEDERMKSQEEKEPQEKEDGTEA